MIKLPSRNRRALKYALSAVAGLALLLVLYLVFTGKWILPQSLHAGPVSLRLYGLCLAAAALAGYGVVWKRKSWYGISQDQAEGVVLTLLISGFIGARIYHVISEWSYYAGHLSTIPAIWHGGLSIFGALLGGIIGLLIYLKFIAGGKQFSWQKLSNILDWLVPGMAVGQAVGRFGNLLNYEVYGYPTGLPWRMYVPPQFRLPPYETVSFFHPLFLYESVASLLIAAVLIKLSPKLRSGSLFFLWLFLYNMVRFFLEIIRVDSVMVSGLRLNQIVAGILSLIGLVAFRYLYASTNSPHH
jgi:phosphatidylglycerol---prolipoprotein diacylglyceryl transferase